jgi:hypothetical protein
VLFPTVRAAFGIFCKRLANLANLRSGDFRHEFAAEPTNMIKSRVRIHSCQLQAKTLSLSSAEVRRRCL